MNTEQGYEGSYDYRVCRDGRVMTTELDCEGRVMTTELDCEGRVMTTPFIQSLD